MQPSAIQHSASDCGRASRESVFLMNGGVGPLWDGRYSCPLGCHLWPFRESALWVINRKSLAYQNVRSSGKRLGMVVRLKTVVSSWPTLCALVCALIRILRTSYPLALNISRAMCLRPLEGTWSRQITACKAVSSLFAHILALYDMITF